MIQAPAVKVRPQASLEVLRTSWISPSMVRVVAGGPGFAGFCPNAFTDMYVKIHFPQPDVDYPEPLDVFGLREYLPREQWPSTRTYTVRRADPAAQELAIDFVVHGDEGLAGPWAAAARPGDRLIISGPGGGYTPSPDADWYLFAGDESALPAITSALEALAPDARGLAFLQSHTAQGRMEVEAPAGIDVHWLVDGDASAGPGEPKTPGPEDDDGSGAASLLAGAVAGASWPAGRVDVFAHGERGSMKALRNVFFKQRGLERGQVSLSGYWAQGRSEDRFQAEKKEPIGRII